MERNKRGLLVVLPLFLLLGIFLGASITSFILFLRKSDNLLAVISYLCLAIVVLLVAITMFVLIKYQLFARQKGNPDGKEE